MSKALDRHKEYIEEDLDLVLLKIKNDVIKAGKYSHLVKVDKNTKIKEGWFFTNGEDNPE